MYYHFGCDGNSTIWSFFLVDYEDGKSFLECWNDGNCIFVYLPILIYYIISLGRDKEKHSKREYRLELISLKKSSIANIRVISAFIYLMIIWLAEILIIFLIGTFYLKIAGNEANYQLIVCDIMRNKYLTNITAITGGALITFNIFMNLLIAVLCSFSSLFTKKGTWTLLAIGIYPLCMTSLDLNPEVHTVVAVILALACYIYLMFICRKKGRGYVLYEEN